MTGGVLTYVAVAVAGACALSVIAAWRLAVRRRNSEASGYSPVEKALAFGVCTVGSFGLLALLEFGRTTGIFRLLLLAAALIVCAVGSALIWSRFGSALRWDSDGLTYFGPVRIEQVRWAQVRTARWDNRTRRLVLECDGRILGLPADLDAVRRMASEMPAHLRSG